MAFVANFEISVDHLGAGIDGFRALLGYIPKDMWTIIDANAYLSAREFMAARRLSPGHLLYESLAFLLKLSWQRGYLMYRFWKSGERLLEPDPSLNVPRLHELVLARVEAGGGRLSSMLEVFPQRVASMVTETSVTTRNLEALGSTVLNTVMRPHAADWAKECHKLMTLGMITAATELTMAKKAAIMNTIIGDGNIIVTADRIENSLNNISLTVSRLATTGHQDISAALSAVRDGIVGASGLDEVSRTNLLETLEEIADQASRPTDRRLNPGTLKLLLAGFGATIAAAGGAAEVWSTWGPQISHFFGL